MFLIVGRRPVRASEDESPTRPTDFSLWANARVVFR